MELDTTTQLEVSTRGPRGDVGVATVADTLRSRYRKSTTKLHLKAWAKKEYPAEFNTWMDHKRGLLNLPRSAANATSAQLAGNATKLSRKKTKGGAK